MSYEPQKHVRAFSPRYYEMNRWGETTPLTMLSLFEETAFSHCDVSGWDVYRLRNAGYGWILIRGGFSMERYPAYREHFTIETWLSASRHFYGNREFIVRGGDGTPIGTAHSLWVFYDLEHRKPVKVLDDILAVWAPDPDRTIPRDEDVAAPAITSMDRERSYDVRLHDIDTNGHVNNVNYLEWALEAVPQDVQDGSVLATVEGAYLHEVKYGQRVRPALEQMPGGPGRCFRHAVFAEATAEEAPGTPTLVARARSAWKPRTAENEVPGERYA